MGRAVLITGGALLAILILSGASAQVAALPQNIELVVKGAGAAILLVAVEFIRRLYLKVNAALDMLPNIVAALWGTPNPEGKRTGGLVAQAARIEEDLQDVKDTLGEMHDRSKGSKTRRED